jgi:hypothetical protein
VAAALRSGSVRERLEGPPVEAVFRPAAPGSARPNLRRARAAMARAGTEA